MYRVVFPMELKLPNMTADSPAAADTLYSLSAVVVHVGSGPHHGGEAGSASACACVRVRACMYVL